MFGILTQVGNFNDDLLAILVNLQDYPAHAIELFDEYKTQIHAQVRLKFYLYRIGHSKYNSYFDLDEVRQYAEEQYELVDAEQRHEVLSILLSTGSQKGLIEAQKVLKQYPWAFKDGVVIGNYDASAIDGLIQIASLGKDKEEGRQPRTLINSVVSYFRELAMTSEDNLNRVISALYRMADTYDDWAYLRKEAKSIVRNFQALQNPNCDITDAYNAYCNFIGNCS